MRVTLDRKEEPYSAHRSEILNLPGTIAVTDGEYYYYQDSDLNAYRTPVDDLNSPQLIMDFGWEPGSGMGPGVSYWPEDGGMIMETVRGSSPIMSSTYVYRIGPDGQAEEIDNWGNSAGNVNRIYVDGGLSVTMSDWGGPGGNRVSYTYNGEEYKISDVSDGAYGQVGYDGIKKLTRDFYRLGDYLYFTGWQLEDDATQDGDSSLFRVRLGETEVEKVLDGVGRFYIFDAPDGETVVYWNDGRLLRRCLDTGKTTVMMKTEQPFFCAGGDEKLAVALSGEDYGWPHEIRADLLIFDDYGRGEGRLIHQGLDNSVAGKSGSLVYVRERNDNEDINTFFTAVDTTVSDEPYYSSDRVSELWYYDGIITYYGYSGNGGALKKVDLKK